MHCGPSSSTAYSSTAVSSISGSSNPVWSTLKVFDFMQKHKNNIFNTCLPNNQDCFGILATPAKNKFVINLARYLGLLQLRDYQWELLLEQTSLASHKMFHKHYSNDALAFYNDGRRTDYVYRTCTPIL